MSAPRGLSAEEAALWEKVARTVVPLVTRNPPPQGEGDHLKGGGGAGAATPDFAKSPPPPPLRKPRVPLHHAAHGPPPRSGEDQGGLDSHWDRRVKGGTLSPDFTLDLHGATLDQAYTRLQDGIGQARAMGARVILLVTGKPRPVEAADRGQRRGAIRAKVLDWLAAGPHAGSIAAIRKAHPRHGGEGALYVVLRKER